MAQVGYTPISLYYSTTGAAVPVNTNLVNGELAINITDGKLYYKDNGGTVQLLASKAGASGDVVGPASATDNAVVRFDGTTGKLVQNSVVTIADTTGDIAGVTTLTATNVQVTNYKANDGTAAMAIANSTGAVTISTLLNADNLRLDGNTLSSTDTNGNVVIAPNGTGDVQLDADTVRIGDSNANATLTTNGTGDLILSTNSGTNSGTITIQDGVDGNIVIAPNGNGQVQITNAVIDTTTIEVTNIKAKDGTASATIADSTGVFTHSTTTVFPAGAVGTPSITTAGDTNTGIFFPAADTIAASTGGSERIRIDSSGNVGIGSTSVLSILEASSTTPVITASQSSTDVAIDTLMGAFNAYSKDNSTTSSGGVGGIRVYSATAYNTSNTPSYMAFYTHGVAANNATLFGNVTERMRIDSSGNVGIGVTPSTYSAGKALEVGFAGCGVYSYSQTDVELLSNVYYNSGYKFGGTGYAMAYTMGTAAAGAHAWFTSTASGTAGNAATMSERMRIDSSGNVGIGTSSPVAPLHVSTTNVGGGLIVNAGARGGSASFYQSGTQKAVVGVSGAILGTTAADLGFFAETGQNIVFFTNGSTTEKMRIDSSGNVGIGTTSPTCKLDIRGNTAKIYDSSTSNANLVIRNSTTGDANGFTIQQDGVNTLFYDNSNGYMAFATNATERARITSGGYFKASDNATYVNSTGSAHEFSNSADNTTIYVANRNASFSNSCVYAFAVRAASTAYYFYRGGSNDGADDEFLLRGDGNAYADGTWNNNGADYAEFFESASGQALTLGATVVLDGNKVREATDQDPTSAIIGVVRPKEPSKASMVVGNTAWNKWANKYLTDDFDRYIMEDHDVVEWEEQVLEKEAVEAVVDEQGNEVSPAQEAVYKTKQHSYESHNVPEGITVPADAVRKTHDDKGNKFQHYKLNPAWDKDAEYTPREQRPEWNIIGLVGQVKVLKGQPTNDRWVKMRDVSATVEEWFIR